MSKREYNELIRKTLVSIGNHCAKEDRKKRLKQEKSLREAE